MSFPPLDTRGPLSTTALAAEHRLLPFSHYPLTWSDIENHGFLPSTMDYVWKALHTAYSEGHQRLVAGLRQIIQAIEQEDYATAVESAGEIDRLAGPHVEFEERYLYPVVEEIDGEATASRLYTQHVHSIATLHELEHWPEGVAPHADVRQRWLCSLRSAVEHAAQTHALLNYLGGMPLAQKQQMLRRHEALQQHGHRWSELHPTDMNQDQRTFPPRSECI